ncbi:hypothetical protein JCM3770_007480 [Rhodotorula araucariae]
MAKPPKTKTKGKLARALSGQQQVAAERAHEERVRQAEADRVKAIKAKIVANGPHGASNSNKKRRLGKDGAAADGDAQGGAGDGAPGAQKKDSGVQPFQRGERILLVGEGNFSFAHSLLLPQSAAAAAAAASTSSSLDAPIVPPVVPLVTPALLCCTAFDSLAVASEKYPDLAVHTEALRAAGATVLFGIDATKLDEHKEVREFAGLGKGKGKGKERVLGGIADGAGFDKIVFNFPHIGQGVTDQNRNIRLNQTLLIEFYRSAALLLRRGTPRAPSASKAARRAFEAGADGVAHDEDDQLGLLGAGSGDEGEEASLLLVPPPPSTRGTVLVTLRTNAPYSAWLPAQLATKGALLLPSILPAHALKGGRALDQPVYRTVRSWAFDPARWEGYEHRRTIGFDEGRSSARNDDLVLTAKERQAKKHGVAVGAVAPQKEGKEDKAPIRTWEFELVLKEDSEPAMRKWGVAQGAKRKASDDPDLSD